MEKLDKNRYLFMVKLYSAYTAFPWTEFFSRYTKIAERKNILEDEERGYIYDQDNFRNFNQGEGIELLINFEFSECQSFIEWEYFVQAFKDTPYQHLLREALEKLVKELLGANLLVRLKRYQDLFPKGLFIREVEAKVAMRLKEQERRNQVDFEDILHDVEQQESSKKQIFESISKERSKIVEQYLGANSNEPFDFDVIEYINAKKKEFGSRDIEKILAEVLKILGEVELDRSYTDPLIAISADYRAFRFKQTLKTLSIEDEGVIYSSIINRILKIFNLILDHHKS
ncbi:MAG: hypothetical protein HRU41_37850 [Saprospiraceae bacterium]|nr:hypothetical protein [Saprospiraceae bacterium]